MLMKSILKNQAGGIPPSKKKQGSKTGNGQSAAELT